MHGKVAVTYFEWAGPYDQKIVVPWRLIDGPESADAFANEIARAPYRRASRTSISGALNFAKPLFDGSGYRGIRRVIDVSGDGANNSGPLVDLGARRRGRRRHHHQRPADHAEAAELVHAWISSNLDIYYEDCVIGGPGAFVIPIRERESVQGGDPHQAGARGRRPHAAEARVDPRAGARAAHFLHHRRADVAGALGELAHISARWSQRGGKLGAIPPPERGRVGVGVHPRPLHTASISD